MKKLLMIIATAGLFQLAVANVPGKTCRDKNGKVVECKKSTSKGDTKAEKDANKVGKGAKHAGYDVTHNKATKKTNINEGNEKYKYQNDMKKENNQNMKKENK